MNAIEDGIDYFTRVGLHNRADALRAKCEWKCMDNVHMPNTFEATCGAAWTFTEGGPLQNEMKYCPRCGQPVDCK